MRNKGKELIEKYYTQMENDINNTMQQAEEGRIDYLSFSYTVEAYRSRFVGNLDVLLDLDYISMDNWSDLYSKSFKFYDDACKIVRKMDFDPSDPED